MMDDGSISTFDLGTKKKSWYPIFYYHCLKKYITCRPKLFFQLLLFFFNCHKTMAIESCFGHCRITFGHCHIVAIKSCFNCHMILNDIMM